MKKKLSLAALLVPLLFCNFIIAKTYKIAFGSCLDQEDPQPIWNTIKKEKINSFIFLGDNVYGDVPSGGLDFMKTAYAQQKKMLPDWLFKKDINVIWDDHDFGENDGGASYPLSFCNAITNFFRIIDHQRPTKEDKSPFSLKSGSCSRKRVKNHPSLPA